MAEIKTEKELMEKLNALSIEDEAQIKKVTCALIGHSRIQNYCFGYYTCARCGEQLGDSLGGIHSAAESVVIVGHKCSVCEANYKDLTWKDKVFCSEPLANND